MNDTIIEERSRELVELTSTYMFPEHYCHTNKLMWKIRNPFTKYAEEKLVLGAVEDGMLKSLTLALAEIAKKKTEFFKELSEDPTIKC